MKLEIIYTPYFDAIVLVKELKPTRKWKTRLKVVEGELKGMTVDCTLPGQRFRFLPGSISLGEF